MTTSSLNEKSKKCNSLFTISSSKSASKISIGGIEKLLSLIEVNFNDKSHIMADIRRFVNGKPTKCGVCFNPYEFDWVANVLVHSNQEQHSLKSKE